MPTDTSPRLYGSSASLAGAVRLAERFYGGITITPSTTSTPKVWALYKATGDLISGTRIREHRGRFRFESNPSA